MTLGGAAARELEQVADGLSRALDLGGDLFHVPVDAGIRDLELFQALRDEERGRLHDAERVAELVADAGRELADGRQTLGRAVLGEQVVAIRLEHDGELDVQDLLQRGQHPVARTGLDAGRVAQHVRRPQADAVHRGQHVHLRQVDADVDAADARPPLEVLLVVRAAEQLVHPSHERLLEARDLCRAPGDRRARVGLGFDGGVEVVDDGGEVRSDQRMRIA